MDIKLSRLDFTFLFGTVLSGVMVLLFLRLELKRTADESAALFRQQNRFELASRDSMQLAAKLNAITAADNVRCVKALVHGQVFLLKEKGECTSGLLTERVAVSDDSGKDLLIEITYGFSRPLLYSGASLLTAQFLCILFFFWNYTQKTRLQNKARDRLVQLAQQVAHDIRSPLSALNLITAAPHKIGESQEIIRSVSQRINEIANELLVKVKSGSFDVVAGGDLKSIVNEKNAVQNGASFEASLESIIAEKKIEFSTHSAVKIELRSHLQGIRVDVAISQSSIKRILSNLINNSVEAITNDGRIYLEADVRQKQLQLTLTDHGRGIPEHLLANLGSTRITQGKSKTQSGSGIGVLSAFQELRKYGGTIEYRSKEGLGTQVTIKIPLLDS